MNWKLKLIKTGEAIIQAQADLEACGRKKEEQYEAMKSGLSLMTNPEQAALQSKKVMTSGDMSSMLSQAEYSQKMHEYDREQTERIYKYSNRD